MGQEADSEAIGEGEGEGEAMKAEKPIGRLKALGKSIAKSKNNYIPFLEKALAASEAKHKTEIKKLWEYFRKQMARKQMKLTEKDNQTIMLERRIGELEEYIEQLKKENEETFADIIHEGHIKGIINRQVNQALSELRDEIEKLAYTVEEGGYGIEIVPLEKVLIAINSRRTV